MEHADFICGHCGKRIGKQAFYRCGPMHSGGATVARDGVGPYSLVHRTCHEVYAARCDAQIEAIRRTLRH
jgi:hypothetical protein